MSNKYQRSKRARAARKAAAFAGLPTLVGHPSHVSGTRYNAGRWVEAQGPRLIACGRISPDGRRTIRTAQGVQVVEGGRC